MSATPPTAARGDGAPAGAPLDRLLRACAGYDSAVIGFSGGVDSTVVLWALTRARGPERVLAVTACSPTFPERELREALELAHRLAAPIHVIGSREMASERFRNNGPDRCYVCKTELYGRLRAVAGERGLALVADGTNLDDEGDYRPGLRAAREHGVRSPLRETGLTKAEVRAVARAAGLPNAEKPAFACLSSRIPYGEVITVEKLSRVGAAEDALRELGFGELRVRHHGEVARIEVPVDDIARLAGGLRADVLAAVRRAGFRMVAVDLAGIQSGAFTLPLVEVRHG